MNKFEHSFFEIEACRTKLHERRPRLKYKFGEVISYQGGLYESLGDNNYFNPVNSNFWRKIL